LFDLRLALPLRRYNPPLMPPAEYALIGYVTNEVGEFAARLRRELQPELELQGSEIGAHVTILPPRTIHGSESAALEQIEQLCQGVPPFEISLGEVESFLPLTPTVFLRVAHAAYKMRELHDRLGVATLAFDEPYPYMPHLTIFRMDDAARAEAAMRVAQERWAEYRGTRRVPLDQLTFVRRINDARWTDIAPVHLGRQLTPSA
jgi:2'-5' RNA ligase